MSRPQTGGWSGSEGGPGSPAASGSLLRARWRPRWGEPGMLAVPVPSGSLVLPVVAPAC